MLDHYLDLADATADDPPPVQSRWNCDGSFWLWVYEQHKTVAEFERLIGRIRSGHISAPLTLLVSCYGGMPAEAALRGMYYAGRIERRYNLRFPLAVAMENQTLPYGLGALWAGAGAQYSWRGICACASRLPQAGDREHEIYWWVGPDGSRILMKWHSIYHNTAPPGRHDNEWIGGYAEARAPGEVVEFVDSNHAFQRRYPYRVIGAFGQGWDDLKTVVPLSDLTHSFVAVARAKTNAQREVIVSNEHDFFTDFEATYGTKLPEVSVAYGNEWDVYSASLTEVSARVRRAVERLRGAEALSALVSLHAPSFMAAHRAARDQAWINLGLYWEHDWTADGPVSREARAAWQRRLAKEISDYVDTLGNTAATALGSMIRRTGDVPRFYAFNPLGWLRSDIADIPYADAAPIHVIDLASGTETPSQRVMRGGRPYVRILARDVPAVGYKVFELRPGAGAVFEAAAQVTGGTVEHTAYTLEIDGRGAITSLRDKARGNREFARAIEGRAINDLGPGEGTLEVEHLGPVSGTLKATADGPLEHTTRITLFRDSHRIEIANEIAQHVGEVWTWDFGFNIDMPDVWHEEVGAVIRAKLLSEGGQYAPRNARYDWLTLNHFADMSGDGVGVTLSNADCAFMRLGHSTTTLLDDATPLLSVLGGGQVDGPTLGIPNQGGDSYFRQRFALQTHDAFAADDAMRFALEHQNPLLVGSVAGGDEYPETTFTGVHISDPRVLLWAFKVAEEESDHEVIARLWNMADQALSCVVALAEPLAAATQVTHVETDLHAAPVHNGELYATFAPYQLQTYRLEHAS